MKTGPVNQTGPVLRSRSSPTLEPTQFSLYRLYVPSASAGLTDPSHIMERSIIMPDFLDAHILELPCPGYGAKSPQPIAWLKANDHFVCSCGARVDLEKSNFMTGMEEVDRSFVDFERTIRQLGGKLI